MATTQGTAIVWGVSATNLTGFSAAVSGAYTITGEDVAFESDMLEVNGTNGVETVYFWNGKTTLGLKAFPSGASASSTALPAIGEKVTVTASTDSDVAGDWICESVSKARKNDGIVEFDIGLKNWDGITPA